ncbi:MAG: HAMP domain-containing protein [Actinomycetia bacterium]|nr:HAMP domain-containing protein [Actinomycetes bacterium]
MRARLGLRARLTLLVTVVFAAAMVITSALVVGEVEDRLVADTRATAEGVLVGYLDSVYGGLAAVGVVEPADTTRFFYLDADGTELTSHQYFDTIAAGFELPPLLEGVEPAGTTVIGGQSKVGGTVFDGGYLPVGVIDIDPDTGALLGPDGVTVTLVSGPVPDGDPHPVDVGDDVVAVAQTLTFADGATVAVGVSSPLQPVTDSLDTIRQVLWIGVPLLVAAIALITWLAASRALRPVHAITSQARAISATTIDERVPVRAANDEINELAATMNEMLGRLEHAQHRQQQFVADASHELRSPVAASRAQLEVARAHPDDADWGVVADAVLVEQEYLGRLIDDLLALSRLDESGHGAITDVDLDDLIETEALRQPVSVRVVSVEPVRVRGNEPLLTRGIRNLVDNAARHATSQVEITLLGRGGEAIVHVDDDGAGVAPADRDRVFDRFTRLDDARHRPAGGAGLGLAISRGVARSHDGDVVMGDSPLGGTRVTFSVAVEPK